MYPPRLVVICVSIGLPRRHQTPLAHHLHTGIFFFHPKIDGYPKAKFPGVVVFSEIYQGMICLLLSTSCHCRIFAQLTRTERQPLKAASMWHAQPCNTILSG